MAGVTICKTASVDDAKISAYSYSPALMGGHTWKVTVTAEHLAWDIFEDDITININDNDTEEILATTSFVLGFGGEQSKVVTFTGIMPDRDLHINISMIDNNIIGKDCEDFKEFTIKYVTSPDEEQETPQKEKDNSYLIYFVILLVFVIIILGGYFFVR